MIFELDKSAWQSVTFGEVVRNVNNTVKDVASSGIERIIAMEHMDPGELKIQRWGDASDGTTFTRRVTTGQTLFGKRRAYQRKVAYAEFDAICSGDIYTFEANKEKLLPELLPFVVQSEPFFAHALDTSAGSLSPRTNWRELAGFTFLLPPLEDQKRIADLLWSLERHTASRQALRQALKSALDVMFHNEWRSEDLRPIGTIGACVTGSTPSKSNASFWSSNDVPFYTPSEIGASEVIHHSRQSVSFSGAEAGRMLPAWSVAVACIGGDMGKSAVIEEPGISNQQITAVIGLEQADAFVLQALLAHPLGRAGMEARESTTIVRKLNKSDLMKVEVPWPDNLSKLRNIVSKFRMSSLALHLEQGEITALRGALQREIFEGN